MPACARSFAYCALEGNAAFLISASRREPLANCIASTSSKSCRALVRCFPACVVPTTISLVRSNDFPGQRKCWPACGVPASARSVGRPTLLVLQGCIAERNEDRRDRQTYLILALWTDAGVVLKLSANASAIV